MIMVKTLFHGWKKVTAEQAKNWAISRYNGIMTMTNEKKAEYINNRIKGATFEQLIN